MFLAIQTPTPLEWLKTYASTISWPVIVGLVAVVVWRIARFFVRAEIRFVSAEKHLLKMATNEVPHIQAATEAVQSGVEKTNEGLEKINENLTGLRAEIREMILRYRDE